MRSQYYFHSQVSVPSLSWKIRSRPRLASMGLEDVAPEGADLPLAGLVVVD